VTSRAAALVVSAPPCTCDDSVERALGISHRSGVGCDWVILVFSVVRALFRSRWLALLNRGENPREIARAKRALYPEQEYAVEQRDGHEAPMQCLRHCRVLEPAATLDRLRFV